MYESEHLLSWIENPRVTGSIPVPATNKIKSLALSNFKFLMFSDSSLTLSCGNPGFFLRFNAHIAFLAIIFKIQLSRYT